MTRARSKNETGVRVWMRFGVTNGKVEAVVAAGVEAGETTVATADENENSETDETNLRLFETTIAGNVSEIGGIVKEMASGAEDVHRQV